ncbi:GIY-YIG nuclease family protein [Microbacterium sp. CIAB417]|uniref:GIY-YIG nuclease family protein n=1 Tax=Microbacterium sp. CIAB417 TaxID=2860287 RepID=UPI001FAC988F|nr:GIY-YIG nuclease family protein [Microbacterium sp. CIAB417]
MTYEDKIQEMLNGFPPDTHEWLQLHVGQAMTGYHGSQILVLQGPQIRKSTLLEVYKQILGEGDSSYGLQVTHEDLLPENRRVLFKRLRGKRSLLVDFYDTSLDEYLPTLVSLLRDRLDVGTGEWIDNQVNVFIYTEYLPRAEDKSSSIFKEFAQSLSIIGYWPDGWNQEAERYFRDLYATAQPTRDRSKSGKARRKARRSARRVENIESAGVYAYSYPTHIESKNEDKRFLIKIGRGIDMKARVGQQARRTEVPEDLVLLRTYPSTNPVELERKVHQHFKDKGQHHKTTYGGSEWFRVSLSELDEALSGFGVTPATTDDKGDSSCSV